MRREASFQKMKVDFQLKDGMVLSHSRTMLSIEFLVVACDGVVRQSIFGLFFLRMRACECGVRSLSAVACAVSRFHIIEGGGGIPGTRFQNDVSSSTICRRWVVANSNKAKLGTWYCTMDMGGMDGMVWCRTALVKFGSERRRLISVAHGRPAEPSPPPSFDPFHSTLITTFQRRLSSIPQSNALSTQRRPTQCKTTDSQPTIHSLRTFCKARL